MEVQVSTLCFESFVKLLSDGGDPYYGSVRLGRAVRTSECFVDAWSVKVTQAVCLSQF